MFLDVFLRCSWDDPFSTDPLLLCSRLNCPSNHGEPAVTVKPTHSQHIETNHSETNSLPATRPTIHSETNSLPAVTRPIPPTALSELLFQHSLHQGLPRLRDFVTAVFSVELERFVLSLLVSTSSRLLESCSSLILLGTSFLLATTHFCFAAHFHHKCDFHLLPPLQVRLFSFLLSS